MAKEFGAMKLLAVLIIVGAVFYLLYNPPTSFQAIGEEKEPTVTPPSEVPTTTCPSDKKTDITLKVVNTLDTTSTDVFNMTGYVYRKINGAWDGPTSVTTTDGSGVSINDASCGYEYKVCFISSDGEYTGTNAKITEVLSGDATIDSEGCVHFNTVTSSQTIVLGGSRHGILKFRLYDDTAKAYFYKSGLGNSNSWGLDGLTWMSTTDNETATAVGAGDELNLILEYRANRTYTDFNDYGHYLLIDAAASKWDTPIVSYGGIEYENVKGEMTTYEQRQFADYEYVYKFSHAVKNAPVLSISIYIKPLAGVNPGASDDLQFDFASIGRYLSIRSGGTVVETGAAKDDSSASVVFAVQDTTLDIS